MSAMVFYSPTVVKGGAGSGSGVRPYRMREAFGRLGYEVIDVSGRHRERHGAMARARERVDAGGVEFVYAEMASTPVEESTISILMVNESLDLMTRSTSMVILKSRSA